MRYQEFKDSLAADKYTPIPQKECNQLVINNQELDRVALSMQRMVVNVIEKKVYTKITPDDVLFEMIQIANEAIATAIKDYTNDKIDFAGYVYVAITHELMNYHRRNDTVKPSQIDGVLTRASYFHIDAPYNDDKSEEVEFDIEDDFVHPEVTTIDFDRIYATIKKRHKYFKREYMDIYLAKVYQDKKVEDIAEEFNCSSQRIYQIVKSVEERMRKNPDVVRYLKQFI